MNKIAVCYWSGTGNTEAMAQAVAEGAKNAGCEVSLFPAVEFSADRVADFDAIAFGCPAMGAEELEENEFDPMFQECRPKLAGKKIGLFGSLAGVTANGCAPGKKPAAATVQTW